MTKIDFTLKKMTQPFEAQYQLDDGYPGPARLKYFSIDADDLEDDMSEGDLRDLYYEMVDVHFRENIYPSAEKVDQFVDWAKKALSSRED